MSESNHHPNDLSIGQQFMQLYVANERRIYGYIYALVHDWAVTDDILQETAMVMWAKFSRFEPGTDFAAWAFRIAYYEVMTYRKSKKSKLAFNSQLIEALSERMQCQAQREDRRMAALRECLRKLEERDRKILELRYEIGTSVEKVAREVDRSVKAVYHALNRIHFRLLECIRRSLSMGEQG